MKRIYIKHIEKCSECPAHKLTRNVYKAYSMCLEYHMIIKDEDFGRFPPFCELKVI